MKIAVVSDIHGNLPALEDIERRGADKIICLGDMIGKGPSSVEVIDLCRQHCDLIVRGNWEDWLYKNYCAQREGRENDVDTRSGWYLNALKSPDIEYLGLLPHSTEMLLSGKLVRMFHAHPVDFTRYFQDSPMEQLWELFRCGVDMLIPRESDIVIYGDIHTSYMHYMLPLDGRLLVNAGSVGNPMDTPQTDYVLLEGAENCETPGPFSIQFVRIPYDIDRAVELARSTDLPNKEGYIMEITTAKYFIRG